MAQLARGEGGPGTEHLKLRLGGMQEWEVFRVLVGRPASSGEINENTMPLEAGLFHTVHFNKGCYMGQETLSKVGGGSSSSVHVVRLVCSLFAHYGAHAERSTLMGWCGVTFEHEHMRARARRFLCRTPFGGNCGECGSRMRCQWAPRCG